jgi:hypothetical protein
VLGGPTQTDDVELGVERSISLTAGEHRLQEADAARVGWMPCTAGEPN